MSEHLNDEAVEALLSGHERDQPLGAVLASIADHYGAIPPSDLGPELTAFISAGGADAAAVADLLGARRRRKTAVIAALTGTVVGKVMIGVSVAAASVVGMQARGIVDVPMLPDAHHRTGLQDPQPAETTEPTTAQPTSVPTPVVTTLTPAPSDNASDPSSAPIAATVANGAPATAATPVDAVEHHDLRYRPQALVDSSDDESAHGHERSDDDNGSDDHDDAEDVAVDGGSSAEHTDDSDHADQGDHSSDHDTPHVGRDHRDDD